MRAMQFAIFLLLKLHAPLAMAQVVFTDPLGTDTGATVGGGWTEVGEFASSTTIGGVRWGPALLARSNGWVAFEYTRPTSPIPWATANARPAITRSFGAVPSLGGIAFSFQVHGNGRVVHEIGAAPATAVVATGDIRNALTVANAVAVRVVQTDTATANSLVQVLAIENGFDRIVGSRTFPGGFRAGTVYSVNADFGGTLTVSAAGGATVTSTFAPLQPAAPVTSAYLRDLEGGVSNGVAWTDPATYATKFAGITLRAGAAPPPPATTYAIFEDRVVSGSSSALVGSGWTELNELNASVTVGSTRFGPATLTRTQGWVALNYQRPTSPIPWNSANARPAMTRAFPATPLSTLAGFAFEFVPSANGRLFHDVGIAPAGGATPTTGDLRLGLALSNAVLVRVAQTDSATANGAVSVVSIANGAETVLASVPFAGGFRAGTIYAVDVSFDGQLLVSAVGGTPTLRTFAPLTSATSQQTFLVRDLEGGISNRVAWTDQTWFDTRFGNVVLRSRQSPPAPLPPTTIALRPVPGALIVGDAPLVSWRIVGPDGRINQVQGQVRIVLDDGFQQDCPAGNGACFIRTLNAGPRKISLTLVDPTGAAIAVTEGIVNVRKQPTKFSIVASTTLPSLPLQRRVSVIFGLARSKDVGGPTPTGPVTFVSDNGATCTAQTPMSNECELVIPNAAGRVQISGSWPGDANYEAATLVHAHVLPDDAAPTTPARITLNAPASASAGNTVTLGFSVENATTLSAPVRIWAYPGGLLCSAPASTGICPTVFASTGTVQVHAEFVDPNPAKAATSPISTITVGGTPPTSAVAAIYALEVPPVTFVGRNFSPRAVAVGPSSAVIEFRLGSSASCTASVPVGTCSLPIATGGTQQISALLLNGGQVLASRTTSITPTTSAAALTVAVEVVAKDPSGNFVPAKCVRRDAAADPTLVGAACANGRTVFEGNAAAARVTVINRGTASSAAVQLALETPRGRISLPVAALAPGAIWAHTQPFDVEGLAFRRKVLPTTWQLGTTAGSTAAVVYMHHAWQPMPNSDYDNVYTLTAGFASQDAAVTEFAVLPRPVALVHGWVSGPETWSHYPQFLGEAYRPTAGEWIALPSRLRLGGAGRFLSGYFAEVPIGSCGEPYCASGDDIARNFWANANELGQFIANWRADLGFGEIYAVAHSAGGLVLRAYIDGDKPQVLMGLVTGADGRLEFAMPFVDGRPMIRKAITIGAPHLGWACHGLIVNRQQDMWGWNSALSTPTWLQASGSMNLGGMLAPSWIVGQFNPLVNDTRGVPFVKIGTPGGPLGVGAFFDDVRVATGGVAFGQVIVAIASTRAPMTSLVPIAGSNRGFGTLASAVGELVCPAGSDGDGVVDFDSATFGDREYRMAEGHLRQTTSRTLFRNQVLPRLLQN